MMNWDTNTYSCIVLVVPKMLRIFCFNINVLQLLPYKEQPHSSLDAGDLTGSCATVATPQRSESKSQTSLTNKALVANM